MANCFNSSDVRPRRAKDSPSTTRDARDAVASASRMLSTTALASARAHAPSRTPSLRGTKEGWTSRPSSSSSSSTASRSSSRVVARANARRRVDRPKAAAARVRAVGRDATTTARERETEDAQG